MLMFDDTQVQSNKRIIFLQDILLKFCATTNFHCSLSSSHPNFTPSLIEKRLKGRPNIIWLCQTNVMFSKMKLSYVSCSLREENSCSSLNNFFMQKYQPKRCHAKNKKLSIRLVSVHLSFDIDLLQKNDAVAKINFSTVLSWKLDQTPMLILIKCVSLTTKWF